MVPWFLADPHLGHGNIMLFGGRPDNWGDKICKGVSIIPSKDVLYVVGDFLWRKDSEWAEKFFASCKCKVILIKGNHDKGTDYHYYKLGFDAVCEVMMIIRFGIKIWLSHMPLDPSKLEPGDINFHGHFHNNPPERWEPRLTDRLTDQHYLITCEDNYYQPVKLTQKVINTDAFKTMSKGRREDILRFQAMDPEENHLRWETLIKKRREDEKVSKNADV